MGEVQLALSSRTPFCEHTKKPIGCTDTPAPAPPAKGISSVCGRMVPQRYSPPPATKPNDTFEIGMIVEPSCVCTGSPTTVLTSTISRMLSMDVPIRLSMGCFSTRIPLSWSFSQRF